MPAQTFDPRIPYIITEYESGESFINQNGLYFDRYGNSYPTLPKTGNGYSAPYSDAAWFDQSGGSLVKPDGTTVAVAGAGQREIIVTFDGGGSVLVTGNTKAYYTSPYAGTIQAWYLTGDVSGSLNLGVWKSAGAIPTSANSIVGTSPPTLVAQQMSASLNVNLWTTSVAVNDIFGFSVDFVSGISKAVLVLKIIAS